MLLHGNQKFSRKRVIKAFCRFFLWCSRTYCVFNNLFLNIFCDEITYGTIYRISAFFYSSNRTFTVYMHVYAHQSYVYTYIARSLFHINCYTILPLSSCMHISHENRKPHSDSRTAYPRFSTFIYHAIACMHVWDVHEKARIDL